MLFPSRMRRPRRLTPGARWFVTVRCARSQFRLTPDIDRTELFKFFLAKALKRCDGVRLHAAVQMSNHFHLVLTDERSQLADLMEYLDGQLARALNAVDQVRGQVLERRYSAIEIVDDEALANRIVYTVTNPPAAGLVRSHRDWPGLVAWCGGQAVTLPCARFHWKRYRRAFDRAMRLGDEVPSREDFTERVELHLDTDDTLDLEDVRAAIHQREDRLARDRSGDVLGVETVLATDPLHEPERTKRGPAPLCHASTRDAWMAFRDGWRWFVMTYREASAAFRKGRLGTYFPEHTFRPRLPLRWPVEAAAAA
ncbi:MAG: hypothetical protein RL846_11035 [Deltaproteobacteria bacterium]